MKRIYERIPLRSVLWTLEGNPEIVVRDYETRGSSVQNTLAMWDSVRRGEKRWIFPYQENADVIFNSSTFVDSVMYLEN